MVVLFYYITIYDLPTVIYKLYDCNQSSCLILSSALLTQNEGCVMVEGSLTAAEQRQISRKKYGDSTLRDKEDNPARDKEQGHAAGDCPEDHKYYEIK